MLAYSMHDVWKHTQHACSCYTGNIMKVLYFLFTIKVNSQCYCSGNEAKQYTVGVLHLANIG